MQVRIYKAQGMLRHGLGIGQVAAATGFADQSHLSRVFKRILGYTPGQFSNCVQYAKPSQR
jgi:transcriptional regulator GlxA family with amidase domain